VVTENNTQEEQEFYNSKLDEFRKRSVSSDNYVQYARDVNNIISEASSSIEEMRNEVKKKKNQIKEIKNTVGEDSLDSFRKKPVCGYHHELREIREYWQEIAEKRQEMFERAMVRGDLHGVKNQKVMPILKSLDAKQIRSDVYEQMNELTEKRIDNANDRLESQIESLDSKHQSDVREIRRQVRDVREAARREASQNGTELIEFMEKMIEREERRGGSVEGLEKHKDNISTGGQVDDVDLMVEEDSNSESSTEEFDEDNSLEGTKTKKEKIKEELKAIESGDSDKTQGDLAEEYEVSDGRVSQIKSEMED